jgi:hypothetical protein
MCEALRDDMESVGSHWYKDRVIREDRMMCQWVYKMATKMGSFDEIGRSGTRCLVPFSYMT